jgi:hypothetical protein
MCLYVRLINGIIGIDLNDFIYFKSELYDFGVTATLENILPACDVIDLFQSNISIVYQMRFSNSLIIHEQNTKKSPPYRLIV